MEVKIPPYLRKGDTVGLICPAGYMPAERTEVCIHVLQQWGFQVKTGETIGLQDGYFAGTDNARLADLQRMLDDATVKAILCARGGYGTSRIIDQVNWKQFSKNPKWIIGYSDVTVLHCHVFNKLKMASLHAPMAGAFAEVHGSDAFTDTLYTALTGSKMKYHAPPHIMNRMGKASGRLIGGNLSLLAHLVGTNSFPDTNGAILFLEDVGEYLYNIDRMLLQLNRAGKLKNLAGLIIGGFTECKDTVIPFGKSCDEIIFSHVKNYAYPLAYGFPVSHTKENAALRSGMIHELQVHAKGTLLTGNP